MPEDRGAEKLSQVERFREMARELGCDESEAAFDAALKRIGSSLPAKDDKPTKQKPGQ